MLQHRVVARTHSFDFGPVVINNKDTPSISLLLYTVDIHKFLLRLLRLTFGSIRQMIIILQLRPHVSGSKGISPQCTGSAAHFSIQ